jgi:hypothetical protein
MKDGNSKVIGEGISARVVDVTPEIARRWLEKNHAENRSLSDSKIEAYASDMRGGFWRLTHQGICFDGDGTLTDGQHRLHAVIRSGATVKMLVFGNEGAAFSDPIDTGRARSVAFLIGQTTRMVAGANVLRMLETGYELNHPQTSSEAAEVLERHASAIAALRSAPRFYGMTGPTLAACAYAQPCDPDGVLRFAGQFNSGEMIQRGDPAFALRAWFGSTTGRSTRSFGRALATLNAIRHACAGSTLATIHVAPEGYNAATTRRRALDVPNTPGVSLVPSARWNVQSKKA